MTTLTLGHTAVFAKVVHKGLDYATLELEKQVVKDGEPKPKVEIEVPLQIAEWMESDEEGEE